MSKKKGSEIEKERTAFLQGAKDNFIPEPVASELFDEMSGFAKYAFNKSHAASYAFISYRTAYLKAHYPLEYYAALLSSVMGNNSKVAEYINDCKKQRIRVLPPDINESVTDFSVQGNHIRFGLVGIKDIGYSFVEHLVRERQKEPFVSFVDFVERMLKYGLTKQQSTALIRVGAFDAFGVERNKLLNSVEALHNKLADMIQKDLSGQTDLFSMLSPEEAPAKFVFEYPECEPLSAKYKLQLEKETIGIYLSGNLLDDYSSDIAQRKHISIAAVHAAFDENAEEFGTMHDKDVVTLLGIIRKITRKTTKKGDDMAFITLEDYYGEIEVLLFPKVYESASMCLGIDRAVCVTGTLSTREEDGVKLLANAVVSLIPNGSYQSQPVQEGTPQVKEGAVSKAGNHSAAPLQDTLFAKQ
ncbi:MAG: DNA polymerase III subunit alpha, partial [Clostridia bacterium]|nr:DNA polymerase III subunit alpha [Clostridia bacterium]